MAIPERSLNMRMLAYAKNALLGLACSVLPLAAPMWGQEQNPKVSAENVAALLEKMNEQRAANLSRILCERTYTLDYKGILGERHAEMQVRAEISQAGKNFTILSESGSATLRNHVLHKLLDGEREASDGKLREQTRLSRENYEFHFEGLKGDPSHPEFLLKITPRRKNKFVWQGLIWVDSSEFAVVRAEGSPAKMPSWWTSSTAFSYVNQKVGNQWIPQENTSDTRIRFGGHAHLVIDYKSCHTELDALSTEPSP